jgi:hypothetical protein
VQYSCSLDHEVRDKNFLTFPPSIHAERVVDEILNIVGLSRNFELLAAECNTVLATEIKKKPYIFYNPQFLNKLFTLETKWEVYAAMAHAIGHHLNSHEFEADESNKRFDMEVNADKFAGAVLYDFGIRRDQLSKIYYEIILSEDLKTHPPISIRITAVEMGWEKMHEIKKSAIFLEPGTHNPIAKQENGSGKPKNSKSDNGNGKPKTTGHPKTHIDDDVQEKVDDPSMRNFLNAKFPFPPPDCNSEFSMPDYVFSDCNKLGDVADKITTALDNEDYPHRFLSVPNGFVVVTQMEQYNDDGTVIEDADTRWVHYPKQEGFSWSINYLSSLVFPKKGFLRVFVFIVTSENYGFEGQAKKSEAVGWHKQGVNRLPAQIANTPYSDSSHEVSLLTYEFEVPESNHKAEQRCPCCKFQAYSHLKHSKLVGHFFNE